MSSASQESRWYDALLRENCLNVMLLLDSKPELLLEGWKEDTNRLVCRGKRFGFWMGRTALHVGARRGWSQLIKKAIEVMTLLEDNKKERRGNHQALERRLSLSLGDLLLAKDGEYKLDAFAMAVVNGNADVMIMLVNASQNCQSNPYEIPDSWQNPRVTARSTEVFLRQLREKTTKAREEAQLSYPGDDLNAEYYENEDFNFLPLDEYLFHFTFSQRALVLKSVNFIRKKIFDSCSGALRKFLLKLRDGQGRTALHVAIDEGSTSVRKYRELIPAVAGEAEDMKELAMNPLDALGRTPLHRAAAKGDSFTISELINDPRTNLNSKFFPPTFQVREYKKNPDRPTNKVDVDIDINLVSARNGFKGRISWDKSEDEYSTALHIAIIHAREGCVDSLLDTLEGVEQRLDLSVPFTRFLEHRDPKARSKCYELDPLQLAALVGNASILDKLSTHSSAHDREAPPKRCGILSALKVCSASPRKLCTAKSPWPAFHLAAGSGNIKSIRVFLNKRESDPMVKDLFKNSALHHAVRGKEAEFHPHLLDYVSCGVIAEERSNWKDASLKTHVEWEEKQKTRQAYLEREEKETRRQAYFGREYRQDIEDQEKEKNFKAYVEREGCVDLLLNAGFDIWQTNDQKEAPCPGPDAPAEFLSWWYKRVARETSAAQSTLNAASNAISVTAALVATASFVGPLQPPLGYGPDLGMQVDNTCVRIFAVCVTLSFYLAVAAIVLAMIPSLPMSQESTMDELQHTRMIVTIAVGLLFPSIISVLIAFGAASIAVIPNNNGSWNQGGLTISTAGIGGLICIGAITLFSIRLLRLMCGSNLIIKKLYKMSSFK